jgi:hypothetical protein
LINSGLTLDTFHLQLQITARQNTTIHCNVWKQSHFEKLWLFSLERRWNKKCKLLAGVVSMIIAFVAIIHFEATQQDLN